MPSRRSTCVDGRAWLTHFTENRSRKSPALPSRILLPAALHEVLVRSMQRFQLGETSEGSLARQAESAPDPVLDEAARAAIALFVREEGRHARELADLLRALGAKPLRRHWSEALFRRGRRLFGFRTKMITVAAAEVVGAVAYAAMAERFPERHVAAFARVLADDERAHLDFLGEWLRELVSRDRAAAIVNGGPFLCVLAAAATLAAWDHRALLAAMELSPAEFVLRCAREVWTRAQWQTSACAVRSGRDTFFCNESAPS